MLRCVCVIVAGREQTAVKVGSVSIYSETRVWGMTESLLLAWFVGIKMLRVIGGDQGWTLIFFLHLL